MAKNENRDEWPPVEEIGTPGEEYLYRKAIALRKAELLARFMLFDECERIDAAHNVEQMVQDVNKPRWNFFKEQWIYQMSRVQTSDATEVLLALLATNFSRKGVLPQVRVARHLYKKYVAMPPCVDPEWLEFQHMMEEDDWKLERREEKLREEAERYGGTVSIEETEYRVIASQSPADEVDGVRLYPAFEGEKPGDVIEERWTGSGWVQELTRGFTTFRQVSVPSGGKTPIKAANSRVVAANSLVVRPKKRQL